MTQTNVTAVQAIEERGKIERFDRFEVMEWRETFRDLINGCEKILAADDAGDVAELAKQLDMMTGAFVECAKAQAATALAFEPERAGELARSFLVISGSVGVSYDDVPTPPRAFQPVTVSVLSNETRGLKDVALLRVTFIDPTKPQSEPTVDALVVRRDRETDDRRVRHFASEEGDAHFRRAVECRAEWLGVSEGPFACTSS